MSSEEKTNSLDVIEKTMQALNSEHQDIVEKQREIQKHRVNTQYERIKEMEIATEKVKNIDLGKIDAERIKKIAAEQEDYLRRARKSKTFITNDFKNKVPYFGRNIIFVGSSTGGGKSTTCANLAHNAIMQKQKVLIITNEENVGDVYNRVTALMKGISYQDHTSFSDEEIAIFSHGMQILSHRMTVVDDSFNDNMGQTTTIEGIESIFNSIIDKKTDFDVVIIDYYQNISRSTKNERLEPWQVQERFVKLLDGFKNVFDGPVILLSQMKPGEGTFKERIEGRKSILNAATCAMELIPERDKLRSKWVIEKSRFADAHGAEIYTGFDKGLLVEYNESFSLKAEQFLMAKQTREAQEKTRELRKHIFNEEKEGQ